MSERVVGEPESWHHECARGGGMTKRFLWNDEDMVALEIAIGDCEPLIDYYRDQVNKSGWWDAVAGVVHMRRGLVTTGESCARRFADIEPGNLRTWAHLVLKVEQYRRDLAEDVEIKLTSLIALVRYVRDLATTVCDAPEIVEAIDRETTGEVDPR